MLVNLHVKNLAIIDEVEVDFSDHFNVLTGETGAGKSIIIGSINLALGQKSPKDVIRKGAEYALVELTFRADTRRQSSWGRVSVFFTGWRSLVHRWRSFTVSYRRSILC